MGVDVFRRKALSLISEMKRETYRDALLIHHDDADGLCSAAIVKATLERESYNVKMLCIEKILPEIIESIHRVEGRVIIYADIGSSHADLISEFNNGKNLTVILDHHDPRPSSDPKVYDLNLENYGFKGERDFSGSTCCYLFSKLFSEENIDLSYLAIVGSCEIPEGLIGLNRQVLQEAISNRIVDDEGGKIKIRKFGVDVRSLFSKLQVLGAVGYYIGGPEVGVRTCIYGVTDETVRMVNLLEERRKKANRRLLAMLYHGYLKETEHIQWFDAGDVYHGMGSKVIGQFCSFLSYQKRLINPKKYIFGMMNMQAEIPGWGRLKVERAKISVRTPKELRRLISEEKAPSAVRILSLASEGFGLADGHEYAASAVVSRKDKMRIIENAESLLRHY